MSTLLQNHRLRGVVALALLMIADSSRAAFYEEGTNKWGYRAPITLDSASGPGSTIILDVDFDQLLAVTTAPGTLDPNSIRVVKNETTLIGEQEFNDAVFDGQSDAISNGQGEIRFILEDNPGTADYHLYFDILANGSKPASPSLVLNATFEQATGAPTRWSTASQNVGGDQNNETYQSVISSTYSVPSGCSTSATTADNSPANNGTMASGRGWHLLGFRDNCEDGSGSNERVRLTRSIRIPSGVAAGSLDFSFQVQAWDGISSASNYDWFVISINNSAIDHRNMGVASGSPALVLESSRFGRSAFGTGLIDHGWRDASLDLSAYAGSTISLRFEARFSSTDNAYRSWIKLDNVVWSAASATVGTPERNTASVASFVVKHDSNGIYCLGEPIGLSAVDATGALIPDFVGTVTLDTQQIGGQFSLTSGNGSFSSTNTGTATYNFVASDSGTAEFLLNYSTGTASIDVDAYLTGDATIRDTDAEGLLEFSPNGFTFTAAPLANPPSGPIDTSIPAQIAADPFSLYLSAYGETEEDPNCGVIETYAGTKALAFWHIYSDPNTGKLSSTVDGSTIATSEALATDQEVTFVAGQAQVEVQYPDVGQIRISAKDLASGATTIRGSANNFVVKPDQLVISRVESSTGVNNPGATTLLGAGFTAAGEPFVVSVDALNKNKELTPNFGQESTSEKIVVSSEALVLPVGGINGSTGDVLNGDSFTASANAGRFTNSSIAFDETGIISLRAGLEDNDYMGAGDVTRPLVSRVGRFYPARFELSSGFVAANCGTFTYMDENAIDLSYEVNALSTAGNPLFNYSDSLYTAAATADFQLVAENGNNGVNLGSRLSATSTDWVNGRVTDTTQISFARAANPDGPFADLSIGARVVDALENMTITAANLNASTSSNCTATGNCDALQIGSATSALFGRLLVLPAQGPETSSLSMGLTVQFYNGIEFQQNTADSCTSYSSSNAALSNYTDNLQVGETAVVGPVSSTFFSAGSAQTASPLTLSAPGSGNTGTVELIYSAPNWLLYDWFGTGDSSPQATATFGGFRGHDRVLYWQEQR